MSKTALSDGMRKVNISSATTIHITISREHIIERHDETQNVVTACAVWGGKNGLMLAAWSAGRPSIPTLSRVRDHAGHSHGPSTMDRRLVVAAVVMIAKCPRDQNFAARIRDQ